MLASVRSENNKVCVVAALADRSEQIALPGVSLASRSSFRTPDVRPDRRLHDFDAGADVEIKRKLRILSKHPLISRPVEGRPEYRELVLEVANAKYVFRYAFDGERLVMLRVFHGREARE